jgi:CRP-like cAMP-binding protein
MTALTNASDHAAPAIRRLTAIAALSPRAVAAVELAGASPRRLAARQEIHREGQALVRPRLMLTGWACQMRMFQDGRRQILGLLLPGDLIGNASCRDAVAFTTVAALTPMTLATMPAVEEAVEAELADAYAISRAHDEFHAMSQIARLGRLTAYERVADLMMELHERLALAGLAVGGSFHLPVTQEVIADVLGLTSVHINRTLKALRQDGILSVGSGTITLNDPEALARQIEHRPTSVSRRAG